jgi:hypothetical protein
MSAQYTKQKEDFNKIIVSLMDKIDEVSSKLNTGEYLEMANMMKDLNAMSVFKEIQVIQQNIQQTPHYQRLRETLSNPKKRSKEMADKMDNKQYKFCDRCDTTVCRDGFRKHQERAICKKIWTSKLVSKNTKKISSERLHKLAQVLTPNFMTHYDLISKMNIRVYSDTLGRNIRIDPQCIFDDTDFNLYSDYYHTHREPANWEGYDVFHKDIIDMWWVKDNGKWKIEDIFVKN